MERKLKFKDRTHVLCGHTRTRMGANGSVTKTAVGQLNWDIIH